MTQKRCPRCGGRLFLVYGSGYKNNKHDFNCMNCGHTENAGDMLPNDKPKTDWKELFKECK
jgi:uncharacterized protein (DUF983 family)